MQLRAATAPGSWGIETPDDPANPPWRVVLAEIAAAGFDGVELGPLGYLPDRASGLRAALAASSLELAAGFVMQPFHDAGRREQVLELAGRTCALLADAGGRSVVLIEALVDERSRTAGDYARASRLDAGGWRGMIETVERAAHVALERGLTPTFHPHAGTYVEFADEVDRLMADLDRSIGLCLDTGHCAYAGIDPASLAREHGDRVRHVHLKDVRLDRVAGGRAFQDAVAARVFCPLGAGDLDLADVRDALAEIGYDGWATIEQDRALGDGRAAADAAASLDHMRALWTTERRVG